MIEVIAPHFFVTGAVVFSGVTTTGGGASATGTAVGAGACTSGAESSTGAGACSSGAESSTGTGVGAVAAGAVFAAAAVGSPGQEQIVGGQFPAGQLSLHQEFFTDLLKLLQFGEGSHSQNSATQFCVLPLQLVSHQSSWTLGTMLRHTLCPSTAAKASESAIGTEGEEGRDLRGLSRRLTSSRPFFSTLKGNAH